MAAVQLISEEMLKSNTYLQDNVDFKQLMPLVITQQDLEIRVSLGDNLWNALLAALAAAADPTTKKVIKANMPQRMQDLMDMIAPALEWLVVKDAVLSNTYKIANRGTIIKTDGQTSQTPRMTDLQAIRDDVMHKAMWYEERLIRFLKARTDIYPEYLDFTDLKIDAIRPKPTAYRTGLNLWPRQRRRPLTFAEKYQGKYGLCDDCDNDWFPNYR